MIMFSLINQFIIIIYITLKRSCCYDRLFLRTPWLILLCGSIFISACSCPHVSLDESIQDAALHLTKPPHHDFQQWQGNSFHPAAYFTCGEWQNPCHASSRVNIKKASKVHSMKNKTTSTNHHLSGGK
jgi:hypothetical protein